jgi:hypothetical protein
MRLSTLLSAKKGSSPKSALAAQHLTVTGYPVVFKPIFSVDAQLLIIICYERTNGT